MTKTVMIIGCGLGGATLAIALMRRGFKVDIYEKAAALQELGAGLALTECSMRVFEGIGIWDEVRKITTGQKGMAFVHYQTAEVITGKHDYEWVHPPEPGERGHTHRALMHGLLVRIINDLDPQALHVDHALVSFDQDDRGVTARFANGAIATADVMIGADGLHSITHKLMFGDDKPRFTGVIAMRATVPVESVKPYLSGGRALNFIGPDRGFLRYGIQDGTLLNVVGLAATDKFETEGWNNRSSREELMSFYHDFHPDVVGIIQHAPADGFFKWALYDREPITTWTTGRVALMGDAAHPMLPYLGMGATQAFEDALVLARALEAYDDPARALKAYETARVERASWVVQVSRDQGVLLRQPDPYNYKSKPIDFARLNGYDARTAEV